MKCICGYEQDNDFETPGTTLPVSDKYSRIVQYIGLYACPKCGTVKIKVGDEE